MKVRPVAPVVPSPPVSNARYREETRRHSFVLDIIWRPLRQASRSQDWERIAGSNLLGDL
jgi:hypothetical protein